MSRHGDRSLPGPQVARALRALPFSTSCHRLRLESLQPASDDLLRVSSGRARLPAPGPLYLEDPGVAGSAQYLAALLSLLLSGSDRDAAAVTTKGPTCD